MKVACWSLRFALPSRPGPPSTPAVKRMQCSSPGRLSSCLENPPTLVLPLVCGRQSVRSQFRDRARSDVHRFALSPSSAASAARTTSFRLGRRHLLLGRREDGLDVSDRQLLPDSSSTSTRASSVPVRVSSHGASDVFTTSVTLRRAVRRMRGEFSSPCVGYFSFEEPHLTTTEPLTPLSPTLIRTVALRAQFVHVPSVSAKTASASRA